MAKILLIEDDPDQVMLYSIKFKMEGLDLLCAYNGQEGLEMAKKEMPQLILSDVVMNNMDGMEMLKRLKADPKIKDIPVVMLTNLNKKELKEKAKELGAKDFWAKTEVLPQDVANRVKKILKISK